MFVSRSQPILIIAVFSILASAACQPNAELKSHPPETPEPQVLNLTSASGSVALPTPPLYPGVALDESRLTFDEFATRQKLPRSEDFPVKKSEKFSGTPVKPVLKQKRARLYRTVLREGAERGPNFAGHYSVVTWGAGLGNFSLALVDARTGKVYFPPFESISRTNYGLPGLDDGGNPAFRLDSKLVVFIGCPGKQDEGCADWENDGLYFYSFNNGRFKLERFVKRKELDAVLKE